MNFWGAVIGFLIGVCICLAIWGLFELTKPFWINIMSIGDMGSLM